MPQKIPKDVPECPVHAKSRDAFCRDCLTPVCIFCVAEQKHKGHFFERLEESRISAVLKLPHLREQLSSLLADRRLALESAELGRLDELGRLASLGAAARDSFDRLTQILQASFNGFLQNLKKNCEEVERRFSAVESRLSEELRVAEGLLGDLVAAETGGPVEVLQSAALLRENLSRFKEKEKAKETTAVGNKKRRSFVFEQQSADFYFDLDFPDFLSKIARLFENRRTEQKEVPISKATRGNSCASKKPTSSGDLKPLSGELSAKLSSRTLRFPERRTFK